MKAFLLVAVSASLAGCGALPATAPAAADAPAQWQAPRPHEGRLDALRDWWRQFDDPLLAQLIDAAQADSPTLAAATSRIEQSRAARVAAGAALRPQVDATAGVARGRSDLGLPVASSGSAGWQASWEIDLFGARRAAGDAAQARLESAQAGWHDARVSVAAEVATRYTAYRACEAQALRTQADAESRAETARLATETQRGGLQSPAQAALAGATAAQGRANANQQRAQCAIDLKSLVALTGWTEPRLRDALAASTAAMPRPAQFVVDSVPAQALARRPDLVAAERELLAAGAELAESRAQRWPRVSLTGSIVAARADTAMSRTDGTLWQVGPLSVTLPIFDGGRRRANVQAAQARLDEAGSVYRGRLRGAVREVEQALVTLQSTAERSTDAQAAADGFRASFVATQARQRGGLASLFELEDARRSDLQAQTALIDLQRERVHAWIALYRALGGDWTDPTTP